MENSKTKSGWMARGQLSKLLKGTNYKFTKGTIKEKIQ